MRTRRSTDTGTPNKTVLISSIVISVERRAAEFSATAYKLKAMAPCGGNRRQQRLTTVI
jgi:hypothetical protein